MGSEPLRPFVSLHTTLLITSGFTIITIYVLSLSGGDKNVSCRYESRVLRLTADCPISTSKPLFVSPIISLTFDTGYFHQLPPSLPIGFPLFSFRVLFNLSSKVYKNLFIQLIPSVSCSIFSMVRTSVSLQGPHTLVTLTGIILPGRTRYFQRIMVLYESPTPFTFFPPFTFFLD